MSTHTRVVRTSDDDTILKRQIIPVGIQTLIDKKNEMRDSETTANRIELHEEKTCHYRTASLMHRDVSPRVICATNRRMDRKLDLAACLNFMLQWSNHASNARIPRCVHAMRQKS